MVIADLIAAMVLWTLAALFNGVMDVIAHRYNRSIFKEKIKDPFWSRWFSSDWRLHYVDGDPAKGIVRLINYFPYPGWLKKIMATIPGFDKLPTPGQLWDAWHLAKMLMLSCFFLGILVFFPFSWKVNLILVVVFLILWNFGFNVMFEYIGIQKEHRRDYFKTFWHYGSDTD